MAGSLADDPGDLSATLEPLFRRGLKAMTARLRSVPNRRALIAACCIAALAILLAALDGSAQTGAAGPDVTVFDFTDISSYGTSGIFTAYSIGTNACNRGDAPLNWCDQLRGCAPGAGL